MQKVNFAYVLRYIYLYSNYIFKASGVDFDSNAKFMMPCSEDIAGRT